ncbi:gamma-interferon-inducible lysosomal thiol reductase-like protein [Leptinotarsa decemlineata]|uniref:gamma-interferon-inducible lysosomal thiol reductase-like protein n=1 Tax=Leptinotarsa decemlineata TaxID=7539 RepID=UPI000C252F51|nr:GILT-like protein 1 [Leptinotarsa decemlineata]
MFISQSKMMWKSLSYFVFILSCCYQPQALSSVKISVYYECLCPDSVDFIKNQLYPVYKDIGKPMNIDLIPFGFASVTNNSGKLDFTCQHGPQECHGNKYHSCAVALFSKEASAEFVSCSEGQPLPASDVTLQDCSRKSGVSWTSLQKCFNSGQADKLLAQNGVRTGNVSPKITFIPTIVFNDHFDESLQDQSLYDLHGVVCKLLENSPRSCREAEEIDVVMVP